MYRLTMTFLLLVALPVGGWAQQGAVENQAAEAEQAEPLWLAGRDLAPEDIIVEAAPEGGIFLWIRKRNQIESAMLTDHSRDPDGKETVYSLRAMSYNMYNGDEKRMLDGKFLDQGLHSLLDSTPESNPYFVEGAFRIYVPPTVVYGYPWGRHGTLKMGEGSWVNIRTFNRPYADYRGGYKDNPFKLVLNTSDEGE